MKIICVLNFHLTRYLCWVQVRLLLTCNSAKGIDRVIVEALYDLQPFEVNCHEATVLQLQAHEDFVNKCDLRDNGLFSEVISQYDDMHRRCVERPKMNCLSGWLTALPVGQNHF